MNKSSCACHAKLQEISAAKIKEINKARQGDGDKKRVNKDNDSQQAKTAMHDMADTLSFI